METDEIISSLVQTCRDEATVTVNQLQMTMINRHLLGGRARMQDGRNFRGDNESDE